MKSLNLNAPINTLSYGLTSFNILRELSRHGVDVALWPIGKSEVDSQAYPYGLTTVEKAINKARYFENTDAPSLRIFHQFSMAERIGKGKAIGFPIFELDTFNDVERRHLRSLDEIFVTCDWAKQVIANNGISVPCHVVPLGYDPEIFKPSENRVVRSKAFTFGNVGKYEKRKGHDELVEIFNKAFEPSDDVQLLIACENPFPNSGVDEFKKRAKMTKMGDKIRFIPRLRSQLELADFYAVCDCMVFPSRAEGWNLPLLECLAMNIPCIATDYSAHTEFCTSLECNLVKIDELEPANDGIWFHGQGNWASIGDYEKEQFIRFMRLAQRDKQVMNPIARKFTWAKTAERIKELI